MSTRRYASEGRAAGARRTRRRVLEAAMAEFSSAGYVGTTMGSLARRAGVSPQTIYNAIGGKAAVVKALYDVQLVGDDEPVPLADRPEFTAVATQPDPAATLVAYVELGCLIYERVGELLGVILADGPGADPEINTFLHTLEQERRIGNQGVIDMIQQRFGWDSPLSPDRAVDVLWTMTSFDIADRLIRRCRWSLDDYRDWVASTVITTIYTQR